MNIFFVAKRSMYQFSRNLEKSHHLAFMGFVLVGLYHLGAPAGIAAK
jgi:hypothetical protein